MPDRRWQDDERIVEVLEEGALLHVAVGTRNGPRVTPTAFDFDGGRLWLVVARGSVKARTIAHRPAIGGLIRVGSCAVMIGGRARLVDPLTARGILSVDRMLGLPFAAVGYLGRNSRHAVGVARERPSPTLPISRIAVAIEVDRGMLIERHRPLATWGSWTPTGPRREEAPPEQTASTESGSRAWPAEALLRIPESLRSLFAAGTDVVLGWESPTGPIALPARWNGTTADTSARLMRLAGAAAVAPACVTSDRGGTRLESKDGVLLSGNGHWQSAEDIARVSIDYRRTSWWRGDRSGSEALRPPSHVDRACPSGCSRGLR